MEQRERFDEDQHLAVAEEVGFEPTVPVTRDGGFQDRCLKPLDHSSGWTIIQPEGRRVNFDLRVTA